MRPEHFRNRWGFAAIQAAPLALLTATPALSAPFDVTRFLDVGPLAIAAGALAFSVVASMQLRQARRQSQASTGDAQRQLGDMRAALDDYEALLAGMPELTIVWRQADGPPAVFGQASHILPKGRRSEDITNFGLWLRPTDGEQLNRQLDALKHQGRALDMSLVTLEGHLVRLSGRSLGGVVALRVRHAVAQPRAAEPSATSRFADIASAEPIFRLLNVPAWIRDASGVLVHTNTAYRELMSAHDPETPGETLELVDKAMRHEQRTALEKAEAPLTIEKVKTRAGTHDMVLFPLNDGSAGYILSEAPAKIEAPVTPVDTGLTQVTGIIDAITTPIMVFDGARRLLNFNKAYCKFWELDPKWLRIGMEESAILDKLRTQGQLPSEADYRAWRSKHLGSYSLKETREEHWYLPDGRTLNVTAVPISGSKGVIYVFEDVTEQLALESRYNALIQVQSETLSALSEGVAVFGTNGRLTLHNPRLSQLWALPMNELGQHPHIDQIAEACAREMPEDGSIIWNDLKKHVIDLDPARHDKSDRLRRADGRLIDFAITRLPDGQTMMTFVDVTESANYQNVLKERNDALVTADRLKDAFVQNVSYELRSPLTNIIGFADLLASDEFGPLTERQRSYTNYIRASSATLGILIDNILDLTNVDAGIAELDLGEQDIAALIEKTRSGLAATFSTGEGEAPINLSVDIDTNLPIFVADGQRIVQILYNLLANAARFSEPGSEIKLSVTSRAQRVVFTIEDEGVGISDEMRAAMFQRFEGRSVDGRQRGAGLGLAIVRTFVNLHGGTVTVEAREPKGTRVVVSIPETQAQAVSAAE